MHRKEQKVHLVSQPVVFETMRTYQGRVRAYELHLNRLLNSWTSLYQPYTSTELALQGNFEELAKQLQAQLESEGLKTRHSIAITPSSYKLSRSRDTEKVIRVYLNQDLDLEIQVSSLDQSYVNRPIELKSSELRPVYPPAVKQNDRQLWRDTCRKLNCDEIILYDSQGLPLESNNSNLWGLTLLCTPDNLHEKLRLKTRYPLHGTLWRTPPADGQILPGITRHLLIDIFKSLGAQVHCEPFQRFSERPAAKSTTLDNTNCILAQSQNYAYFLSSTLKSLSWVKMIDMQPQVKPPFLSDLYSLIEQRLSRV